jgi:2-methylisocitrate lyase-like PEP mutase family enzyme
MALFPTPARGGRALRELFAAGGIVEAPGCFDALSVRILEAAGFRAGFLGGFSVAATRLGLPDAGLLGYGEMVDQARDVCAATSLPILGDGDTGYGNPINAERTLLGFARAGLACVMIEDQRWPKRCGHTAGKEVVDREEALARIRACLRVREEHGLDVLIMARTDALATDGLDEALWRAQAFADLGADITFLEAPTDVAQMRRYCEAVPGIKTANLVEDGKTPWLPVSQLEDLGYGLVLYPVSLLLRSVEALRRTAEALRGGAGGGPPRAGFDEVQRLVGFPEYRERARS